MAHDGKEQSIEFMRTKIEQNRAEQQVRREQNRNKTQLRETGQNSTKETEQIFKIN